MVRFSLRQLAFLSEAARCGGIAPAARNLNISPAAVSSALDKLEAVTGLTLFDRFPARGMRLTRVGAEFLVDAEDLLKRAGALDRHAVDLANGESGTIRVGTHFAMAQQIVLPSVLTFRGRFPRVRIEVVEDDFPSLVVALDAGEVDALVVFNQGFDASRFEVETLKALPPWSCCPHHTRWRNQTASSSKTCPTFPISPFLAPVPAPPILICCGLPALTPRCR